MSSKTATWNGSANSVTLKNTETSQARIASITVTYEVDANAPTLESLAIDGTPSTTTYYVGDTPSAEGLTVTATYSDETTADVTSSVTWTYDPTTIAKETTSVSATASYGDKEASTTFNITVNSIGNTAETAYTVAEAVKLIDAGKGLTEEVYVKGIVSQVDNYNETYGSITYWISEDGTTEGQQFQCYSGLDLESAKFTSINDLKLGTAVVVKGQLKKYNSTYELNTNNVIISKDESNAKTLSSIEISGTPSTTTYYVGDAPSAKGLIVKAIYNDDSEIDVTEDVTWTFSPKTFTEEGNMEVIATAEYRRQTATTTLEVNIIPAPVEYTYTLDLSTKTYYAATTTTVDWNANVAKITLGKAESTTNANNYIGGSTYKGTLCAHTRIYKGQILTISPNAEVKSIVLTATSDTYAKKTLSYENATAEVSGAEIIVTPIVNDKKITITVEAATRFTQMKIYYTPIDIALTSAGYATFCLPYDATVPEGLTAYTAADNGETIRLTAIESGKIAAGEGVVLKGEEGTYTFVASAEDVSATEGNQMVGVTENTNLTSADNAYMLTRKKSDGSIAFRLLATDYTLSANKAYLKLEQGNSARTLISAVWDDDATGIYDLSETEKKENGAIYNLAGQKLMRAQKGVNIINGKLIVK